MFQTVNVTSMTNTYCCLYSVETADDGQWICPKLVVFFIKINVRNSASRWLLLYEFITMHGPLNVKTECVPVRVLSDYGFEHNYFKTVYKMKIYGEQLRGEAWK